MNGNGRVPCSMEPADYGFALPATRMARIAAALRKSSALLALVALLAGASGCSTVVKRAIKEARGAQSKAREVPGTISSDFERFNGVIIKEPRTDLGDLVSAEFREALPGALRHFLTEAEDAPFVGGQPELVILPQIQWYHDTGMLGGVAGSYSYAVVLFLLGGADADLGRVQVVTKDASSHVGDEGMAESMAKELAEWFVPPPPDEEEAEE